MTRYTRDEIDRIHLFIGEGNPNCKDPEEEAEDNIVETVPAPADTINLQAPSIRASARRRIGQRNHPHVVSDRAARNKRLSQILRAQRKRSAR